MEFMQLTHDAVLSLLPERDPWSHKGDYGRLLLLCGSRGYTGAAALAAMGALRCGAGLVYLAVPACIYPIEAAKLTEPVVLPLPGSRDTLEPDAVAEVLALLEKMDTVLIGPGSGRSEGTLAVTEAVLRHAKCPVVVDADGINVLSAHRNMVRDRIYPTILTPHDGEFRRMGGCLDGSRAEAAGSLARSLGSVVLLKGHETVITDGNRCYRNPTGNPGMATGGSGDVLAGIITALLGQGLAPLEAAACGAFLHGAAGDLCAAEIGQYGMLPSDLLKALPRLLK